MPNRLESGIYRSVLSVKDKARLDAKLYKKYLKLRQESDRGEREARRDLEKISEKYYRISTPRLN